MLNRNIPIYEGNLPYLYACYSPEDEMLVLPVLTRMYNEGFRLWSASLADKVSDFVAVRHVSTSACVIMFMSRGMMERINAGVPEVLAACRSSLLRAVVLLDDARPDSRMFALTSPEMVEYQRSNDAGFWLYAYSTDYLERCRGPWPEIKIELREPAYEDVREEVIAAEYISLENIITRGSTEEKKSAVEQRYPNNRGYIRPQPDSLTYEPLGKVEAAMTVHDRDYDDAISLLNQCAEKQIDIIINHTRPGVNTIPAMPSLSPLRPLPDKQAELESIRSELERSAEPVERPERRIDPEVRTKADMIVEPEEKTQSEADKTEQPVASAETIPYIAEPELTVSSIAESIRQLTGDSDAPAIQAEEKTEPAAEQTVETVEETAVAETVEDVSEDRSETVAEKYLPAIPAAARSTVQVVVRKPQTPVRVTPVKKRVITEKVQSTVRPEKIRQNRVSASGNLRVSGEDTAALEQYIRDIALAAVSAGTASTEQQPASKRRYGRLNRQTDVADQTKEPAVESVAAVTSGFADAEPVQESVAAATETAAGETSEEKVSRRKNRYPHKSEVLAGLLAALRRERNAAVQSEPVEDKEPELKVTAASETQENADKPADNSVPEQAGTPMKIIRLSDAISERRISDLQEAVNKFMCIDNSSPEATPLSARVYLRRR